MSISVLTYPAAETGATPSNDPDDAEAAARAAGERPSGVRRSAPPIASPTAGEASAAPEVPQFDQIYHAQVQFVWRALSRLGVPQDQVPDAVQDVFLVVHRRLVDFEHRSSVKTWLFGIAMRVASDRTRRARRRPTAPLPAVLTDTKSRGPLAHAMHSEAVSLLYQLLEQLSAKHRAVFVLAELEQMSVAEIAACVDTNVHTVSSRLKKARKQFEAALRRHQARNHWRQP